MAKALLRTSTVSDAHYLATRLRPSDVFECHATGNTPSGALQAGYLLSPEPLTATLSGQPVAMFGCAPHPTLRHTGVPWMLGTAALATARTQLVRDARKWVDSQLLQYTRLLNYVSAENIASQQWLEVIGFTLTQLIPDFGPRDAPFWLFERSA